MTTTDPAAPDEFDPERLLADAQLITDAHQRDLALDAVIRRCRGDNERMRRGVGRLSSRPEAERNRRVILLAKQVKEATALVLAREAESARARQEAADMVARHSPEAISRLIVEAARGGTTSNAKRLLALELARCAGRNRGYARGRGSLATSLWRDHDLRVEASLMFEYARADVEGREPVTEARADRRTPLPAQAAPVPSTEAMTSDAWLYNAQAALWRNLGSVGTIAAWCEAAERQLRQLRALVENDHHVKSTLAGLLMDLDQASSAGIHKAEVRSLLVTLKNDGEMYRRMVVRFENLYGEPLSF